MKFLVSWKLSAEKRPKLPSGSPGSGEQTVRVVLHEVGPLIVTDDRLEPRRYHTPRRRNGPATTARTWSSISSLT